MTCPDQGGPFANCNFTSTIEWEVTQSEQSIGSVLFNVSDPNGYAENVTVSGIDIEFTNLDGAGVFAGASFAVILSPNASLNGIQLNCIDTENETDLMTETCVLSNIYGKLKTN